MIHNQHGKPLDDLDTLRLHITARGMASERSMTAYTVTTADGAPLVGHWDGTPSADLIATNWRASCPLTA